MIKHRQHNIIFSIKSRDNQWLLQHKEIEEELVSHFKDMLVESIVNRKGSIQRITSRIPHLVNPDENEGLMREICFSKVEEVVMVMLPNKALD